MVKVNGNAEKREGESAMSQLDTKEELTEEDLKKKEEIELMIERIQEKDEFIVRNALNLMCNEIRSSTSSMTAIPKPLKFLRPLRSKLVAIYESMPHGINKELLADIISVLSMIVENSTRDTLRYKLAGTRESVCVWGHEYLRHLVGELTQEYRIRVADGQAVDDLMRLTDEIVPYNMKNHAEPEACDLLLEVEHLERLLLYVEESNFQRICRYLVACAQYVLHPEDAQIFQVALQIYEKFGQFANAMQLAIRLGNQEQIHRIFNLAGNNVRLRRQLALMLARCHVFDAICAEGDADPMLIRCLNNENLSKCFQALLVDLQITEPKELEDIYKSHLSEGRRMSSKIESARQNMAGSFVNGFVNAASGADKLLTTPNSQWLFKNKENGLLVAVASLGLLYLWDYDTGMVKLDHYLTSDDENIKAGAILGTGIVVSGLRSEFDPAIATLVDTVYSSTPSISTCSALGLALAYAGSNRESVLSILKTKAADESLSIEVTGMFGLSMGLISAGSANHQVAQFLSQLYPKEPKDLESPYTRLISIGIGLVYLGKKELAEDVIQKLAPLGQLPALIVETLAYANSGNPVDIQKFLQKCEAHLDKDDEFQGVAVLGIALVSMSEEIGSEMALRMLKHLLRYGELSIRRAVPLALSILCVGNPNFAVIDTLSKLSHDHNPSVAMGAVLGLGFIGVGTNNSRIAQILRQLVSYYYKDQNLLYVIRIAQGLLHLGKGTMSIRFSHFQGLCTNYAALGAFVSLIYISLDMQSMLLTRAPHLLYLLSVAIHPSILMTLDDQLEPVPVSVRVGTAVDVVGQAGKPKSITGFQTHMTPVLLAHSDRAEFASEQWRSETDILEGFVLVTPSQDTSVPMEL